MTHPQSLPESERADASAPRDLRAAPWPRHFVLVVLMLAPTLAAVWAVPWFTTQDGLAHLYNASILIDSLRGGSTFGQTYQVHWDPLPNWGGHLTLMGLLTVLPPRAADRAMTSLTLAGVALTVAWLRRRTSPEAPSFISDALAVLSAASFSWLMGFASFQLGVCLFAITLGIWWPARDDLRPGRMAALAGMLTVGYFCHLVSAGLTVFALAVLAVATPSPNRTAFWRMRVRRLSICMAPLGVLVLVYLRLAQSGGTMSPRFARPVEMLTFKGWMGRIGWLDPVSFAVKDVLPFTERISPAFAVFNTLAWLSASAILLALAALTWSSPDGDRNGVGERRAWLILSIVLLAMSVFGPDSMGAGHGDYLPQRIALLSLVTAAPAIGPSSRSRIGRLGGAAMLTAVALQGVSVWDYAAHCQRTVAPIAETAPRIGRGVRIAALLGDLRTRFRINPALHAPDWLGVEGNVVWNNYETRHYYFPVQFKPGLLRPDSYNLEDIALAGPVDWERGTLLWEKELSRSHEAIDVVLAWRGFPRLDVVTERWFKPAERLGDVTIWRPRDTP